MHNLYKGSDTKLIFVTPPPLREKNISLKFQGASQRLNNLIPELMYMASKKGFSVVDVYHPLLGYLIIMLVMECTWQGLDKKLSPLK